MDAVTLKTGFVTAAAMVVEAVVLVAVTFVLRGATPALVDGLGKAGALAVTAAIWVVLSAGAIWAVAPRIAGPAEATPGVGAAAKRLLGWLVAGYVGNGALHALAHGKEIVTHPLGIADMAAVDLVISAVVIGAAWPRTVIEALFGA